MTDEEKNANRFPTFHYEGDIPVFETRLSEVERKATAAETRDEQYKKRQERTNTRLAIFTGLLVLTSLISGVISIWQARIANRSAGAAQSAAKSAADTLGEVIKGSSDTHALAEAAGKQADATKTQADRTKDIADRTLVQARLIREANEIAKSSIEISQRPYITIGRKDGILAEIRDAEDKDGWATLTVHLQNSGHLPAKVCIYVDGSAWPLMPYHFRDGQLMMRQKGKDSTGFMRIMENACPNVAGESVFDFIVDKRFKRETWEQLKKDKSSQIMVTAYLQSCDTFGRYVCKSAWLQYLHNAERFIELSEGDCTSSYRYEPDIPAAMYGSNEPLGPCPLPGEDEENQKAYLRHSEEYFRQQQKQKKQ